MDWQRGNTAKAAIGGGPITAEYDGLTKSLAQRPNSKDYQVKNPHRSVRCDLLYLLGIALAV